MKDAREAYNHRNTYLNSIGYRSYSEYLKSDEWKAIRLSVLSEFPKCTLCEKNAAIVHHAKYGLDVLLGIRPYALASLCRDCHEFLEFTEGVKGTLAEANAKLFSHARDTVRGREWLQEYYAGCKRDKSSGRKVANGRYAAALFAMRLVRS